MALRNTTVKRAVRQATNSQRLPAAIGGMDGRVGIGSGNPNVAIYTYNLMASEYGMKVRNGYQEHCIDLLSTESLGARTILPYSPIGDDSLKRLFVVTNEGIWDCTTYDAPVLKLSFSTTTDNAGYGTYVQYTTDAGDNLMFYADGENGLHTYDQTTDTWTATTGITGADATKVRFVMVHKLRIWLIEKDSADAWYLPINSIAGLAVKFQFGAQFKRGGILAGLYNWTVDGGIGVDDYLVAISSGGDVLTYQGSDPESTQDVWQNRGVYYVGEVAKVRKCAVSVGGSLYILSVFGLIPLSSLLNGLLVEDVTKGSTLSGKMSFLLQRDISEYPIDTGWFIELIPSEGVLIIASPLQANNVSIQYVFDISNDTFGWWRGVPMICADEWNNTLFFGTEASEVKSMDVDLDDVRITPINEQNGVEIPFSTLFAFLDYDAGGRYKRGVNIRPDFMSPRKINFEAKFVYEYEIFNFPNTLSGVSTPAGRWDNGLWDSAIWGSGELVNRAKVLGGSGYGRTMAVAINGAATSECWLMSYDVMWNTGGML